jgi:class 3 adenylate cyclase
MRHLTRINPSGYLARLQSLIEARLQPGADKDSIDAKIWDIFGDTWTIMFTDLSGFSRYVAEYGIIHFLQNIYDSQRIFEPCIVEYDGVLLKVEGDSMMLLFRQPAKAVECAIKMQQAAKAYNVDKSDAEKILLCVGIGHGRILKVGDHDVFGEEVNSACKLGEDTARAWEILVTDAVAAEIRDMPHLQLQQLEHSPPGAKAAYKLMYQI